MRFTFDMENLVLVRVIGSAILGCIEMPKVPKVPKVRNRTCNPNFRHSRHFKF